MNTFDNIFPIYAAKFGHTFTSVTMTESQRKEVTKTMMSVLSGKRGIITDKELYGDLPSDALI